MLGLYAELGVLIIATSCVALLSISLHCSEYNVHIANVYIVADIVDPARLAKVLKLRVNVLRLAFFALPAESVSA